MRTAFSPRSFYLPTPIFYLLTSIFYLLTPTFYLYGEDSPKILLEKSGKVIFSPEESRLDDNFPLGVQTCEDGQIKMVFPSYLEIRAKENSVLSLQKHDEFKVSSGIAGFRKLPGRQISISTPHCRVESTDGIFVIRVYRTMTRLAVLKGAVNLTWNRSEPSMAQGRLGARKSPGWPWFSGPRPGEPPESLSLTRTILPKQEIAACSGEVSDIYKTLDDLYFAWYWDPPLKR